MTTDYDPEPAEGWDNWYRNQPPGEPQPSARRDEIELWPITPTRREEIAKAQRFRCAICHANTHGRYAIDHDHDTGAVRAMLCGSCNAGLGMFGDSPAVLRAAMAYLEHFKPDFPDLARDADADADRLPRTSHCPGSYGPIINSKLAGEPGPGIFACDECGTGVLKVHMIGRYKGRREYMAGAHFRPGEQPRRHGPGVKSLRV